MATVRTIPESKYYSGQGQVISADRDPTTGKPINARQVANAPSLEIQLAVTQTEHKESMSGQRSVDFSLLTERSATGVLTLESVTLRNLVDGFYGSSRGVTGGSVVEEEHVITTSADGGVTLLDHQIISAVTIVDESDVAIDTDAYYVDEEFGMIQWRPEFTPAVTGTVKVSYTYDDREVMDAFTQSAAPEKFIRFNGINTIDESFVCVDIPRAQMQPLQSLQLITEEIAQIQLNFTILPDPLINTGSRYYRQTFIPAVA